MLVVEALKGGLLHSIGVMIVYVFILHLSHTCLFNFLYLWRKCDGERRCVETLKAVPVFVCWFLVFLELLLICCSESCRQCDDVKDIKVVPCTQHLL